MGDAVSEPTPDQAADQQTADTAPADDAAAKAIAEAEKWKALARKHEEQAKANRDAAKKLAEIEAANQSDLEKAVNAARAEGAAQATQAINSRLVSAEARALAAEAQFRNPATAVRLLDLSEVSVTDTGEVDTEAIKEALKRLGEDEPYLLASSEDKPAPAAQAGIGVGASKAIPSTAQDKISAGLARYMQ
jgi:maltoporin